MAHNVKCAICGKIFNRDVIQAVKHGARRYSHFECEPDGEKVPLANTRDEDLENLLEYIDKLFKGKQNHAKVNQSIKKFHNELGYSYTGIQKALIYFYEIKHNSLDKANGGISIVPFCYQDAYNYYYSLFLAQQATQDKTLITKVKEIIIKPPKMRGTKQQFFDLGEWEDEE